MNLIELMNPNIPSTKFIFDKIDRGDYFDSYIWKADDNILEIYFTPDNNGVNVEFAFNGAIKQTPQYAYMAMAIFQTVLYQIKQYVLKHNPAFIRFSSDENETSRLSLYRRICKNVKGYKLDEENGYFLLTKEETEIPEL